jgi:hypothetical protein
LENTDDLISDLAAAMSALAGGKTGG